MMLNRRFALLAIFVVAVLLITAFAHLGQVPEWNQTPIDVWHQDKGPDVEKKVELKPPQIPSKQPAIPAANLGDIPAPAHDLPPAPQIPPAKQPASPAANPPAAEFPPAAAISPAAEPPTEDVAPTNLPPSQSRHVQEYYNQVFADFQDPDYTLEALTRLCARTEWTSDNVYMKCDGIANGLSSIISQLKVCFKLAVESGVNLILPSMPIRDNEDLKKLNLLNRNAVMDYEKWFDAEHVKRKMEEACPRMKVVHPNELNIDDQRPEARPVKKIWRIQIEDAYGYTMFQSYFWVGRPWRVFFNKKYKEAELRDFLDPSVDKEKPGVTIVEVGAYFLLFRVTDDPSGEDLKVWNDLAKLIRMKSDVRTVARLVAEMLPMPYYSVHYRAEDDNIWLSPEEQRTDDLKALDEAWEKYGDGGEKPVVYISCGDESQIQAFADAARPLGWNVTHKYKLLEQDRKAHDILTALPFDFQGGVDMGMMMKADFFVGIQGSAMSSTVGNVRDPSGRYRGSSLMISDDAGARTLLMNNMDSNHYPCCL